jgi:NTP pyrophosphatase (non-canonical NTP hydrolase)
MKSDDMKFDELTDFAKQEHERLVKHFDVKNNPKTKYTMFAKLVEEIGELSEAILTYDSLQRSHKLRKSKAELEGEFADVILVTMILAQELNINLETSLKAKIKKIKARKY